MFCKIQVKEALSAKEEYGHPDGVIVLHRRWLRALLRNVTGSALSLP